MSKLGLKYISPDGMNFPVINGGKWNIASNLRGDFTRHLSEAGVEQNDTDSVALFMKFIRGGMLLSAAKRVSGKGNVSYPGSEQLWLFVPQIATTSDTDLIFAVREMVGMFDHPEAFLSSETFRDHLSDIFQKDFTDGVSDEKNGVMTGSRMGYIPYETSEELKIILSTGYKEQYGNFGIILLTDNPVRVEASLPRIYVPELILHRYFSKEEEEQSEPSDSENVIIEKETAEEEIDSTSEEGDSIEIIPDSNAEKDTEPDEKAQKEDDIRENSHQEEISETKSESETESESDSKDEEEDLEDDHSESEEETVSETDRLQIGTEKKNNVSTTVAFWTGFIAASMLFILIYIVVHIFQG